MYLSETKSWRCEEEEEEEEKVSLLTHATARGVGKNMLMDYVSPQRGKKRKNNKTMVKEKNMYPHFVGERGGGFRSNVDSVHHFFFKFFFLKFPYNIIIEGGWMEIIFLNTF